MPETLGAIGRLRACGKKLVLVTGQKLEEMKRHLRVQLPPRRSGKICLWGRAWRRDAADFLATLVASGGFNPPHYRRDNDYVEENYCDRIGSPRIRVCFGSALERGHRGGRALPRSRAQVQLRAAPSGLLRSSGCWRRLLSGLWFLRAAVPGFRSPPIPRATWSFPTPSLAVTDSAERLTQFACGQLCLCRSDRCLSRAYSPW
jgi:hypothetical protein